MFETSLEAKAELQGWIDSGIVVDYWLVYNFLEQQGIVSAEKHGVGTLSREIGNVIKLKEQCGREIVVTASGREIIDYCEPPVVGDGPKVQVRSLTHDTWMAFKPSAQV